MKLVISHKGIKRELETPFALCCQMAELDQLIALLQEQRRAKGESTYGWIRVDPSPPADCAPNPRPLGWTEAGNMNPPITFASD
jgi:hypothetical protein